MKSSNQLTAFLIHFLWALVELLRCFRQVLALRNQIIQIALPFKQFLNAIMEDYFCLVNFFDGFAQFVHFAGLLILLKLDDDFLDAQVLILVEQLPLLSYLFEEYFQHLVQQSEDDSLRVVLVSKGIGDYGLARDLNEAELIFMFDGVPSVFG